jgi:hypothetical protein
METSNLRRSERQSTNKHPGLLVKMKRRTKAEVERDRALKQMERALKEKEREDNILRVAQLEDRMAIEDANEESAHPRRRDPRRDPRRRDPRRDGLSYFYPPSRILMIYPQGMPRKVA